MNNINKFNFMDVSQETKVVKGILVYVSYSEKESDGLKESVRDILTKTFEARCMEQLNS